MNNEQNEEVTATEAARRFADLLDEVEHHGRRFTIIRRGKPVAMLRPPSGRMARGRLRRIPGVVRRAKDLPQSNDEPRPEQGDFGEIETILRPDPQREHVLRELLRALQDLGCSLTMPGGSHRRDYVNVSRKGKRGRVVSIHVATGRAEFQTNSWDRVGKVKDGFEHLAAGNKAAHSLNSKADVEKILEATRIELRHRGL